MTNLVKKPLGLVWRTGRTSNIIRYCEDQEALKIVLSEGLYQAISLHSEKTSEAAVKIMILDVLEDYANDPVEVVTQAITKIRKGYRKIYGKVTPTDLREMLTEEAELISLQREREHNERKGFGEVEVSERNSGRISDFFGE
jgi:hypothetical protein